MYVKICGCYLFEKADIVHKFDVIVSESEQLGERHTFTQIFNSFLKKVYKSNTYYLCIIWRQVRLEWNENGTFIKSMIRTLFNKFSFSLKFFFTL
jgi:hypothetical protein